MRIKMITTIYVLEKENKEGWLEILKLMKMSTEDEDVDDGKKVMLLK